MGVAIIQPLWLMAGHYMACGGWRAAMRPVAGRYAAWFQGRYAANELTHSRYITKRYHCNSGTGPPR